MKRAIALLLILFAILATFSFASFRVMSSRTAQNSSVSSMHSAPSDGVALKTPTRTLVQVDGAANNRLAAAVRRALAGALRTDPVLGSVELVTEGAEPDGGAFLNVSFDQNAIFWSPVHARAELAVAVNFASNGDISFRRSDPPIMFIGADHEAIQVAGDYSLADVSWGLISHPGYEDYLANKIAETVVASLKQEFKRAMQ